jgi:hypothetical protein
MWGQVGKTLSVWKVEGKLLSLGWGSGVKR